MRLLLASRALWRACLTGGTRQAEAEHVSFSGLEVLLPDRVVMREALPAGIHVPFAAMVRSEGEGEEYRLAQLNDLAASVKAQLAQLTAQLKSGLRVKVASETSVMGLKVAAGTQIELIANLGHYSGAPPADVRAPPLAVKIHLHAAIQKLATAVLEVSLQLDAVPECAIALPSLGLRLGQLKVPSLDWSQVEVPRLFESTLGFGVAADWKLVVAEAPTIEAEVEDGTLKSLKIGVPKVEVKYGGQPAGSVVGLSVAYGSTGWKVQAALQPEPVEVEAGKVSLGLLNVAWSRFKVVLSLDVASGTIKALASDIALSISGGGDSTKRVDLIVGIVFDGDRLSLTGLRIERPSPADLTGLLTKVVKGTVDAFVMDIAAGTADLIQAVEHAFLEVVGILAERAGAMLQQVLDLADRLITALSELATEAGLRVDVRFEEGSFKPIAILIGGAKVASRARNEWFAAGLKVALTLAQQTAFVKAMDRPSVQELLGPGLPEKGDTAVLATAAPAAAPASGTAPTSVVPKMVSDVQAADLRRMAQTAADIQLLMAVSPEHLAFVREVRTASDSDDLAARVKELCSRSRRCTPNAVFPPRPFQKDITPEKASEVCGNKAYYVDFWASGENVWNAQLAGALERFLQSVQGASAPCGRDTSKPGSLEDQRTTLLLLRKEMALALPKAQESADMIGDMLSRFEFISIERGMLSYRYAIKNRLNLFELHLIPKWWYPLATPLFESVPIKHDYPSTRQFLGWLITILMVSFGAPFWYDLLSKLANLRPTGPKPAQTPDPTP